MKLVFTIAAALGVLMIATLYDQHQASSAREPLACRLPKSEGDVAVVTFTVRAGQLVADCQYASTRPSQKRKGG